MNVSAYKEVGFTKRVCIRLTATVDESLPHGTNDDLCQCPHLIPQADSQNEHQPFCTG
jgi:hypothetical protein